MTAKPAAPSSVVFEVWMYSLGAIMLPPEIVVEGFGGRRMNGA